MNEGFHRPPGVTGGVDPRHRGQEPALERDDVPGPVDPRFAVFAPGPGERGVGLQPPPPEPAATADSGDPRDRSSSAYDPWADEASVAATGDPAMDRSGLPEPAVASAPPDVDVRDVLFGRRVPWRFVALGAAAVLAVAGVGGWVGGLGGKLDYAAGHHVELVQEQGRPGGDPAATPVGAIVDRVQPAVVSVLVGDPLAADAAEAGGTGSGFVIDDDGHILTNNHVVSAATGDRPLPVRVQLRSAGGPKVVDASVVGRDTRTDLAVLRVTGVSGLSVARLGDSDAVRVGDPVVAMGSPMGLDQTVTSGIVSALHRPVTLAGPGTDTDGAADAIQTDAAINPGNSGGPLVDARGAVIGINTSIYSTSGGSQGLGFSIPINTAADIAEQIIAEGTARHPDIGVTSQTVANPDVRGAELATVAPDGPAAAAGLREGDVITGIGARGVGSSDELTVAIWTAGADRPVDVHFIRGGQGMTLQVTPELR